MCHKSANTYCWMPQTLCHLRRDPVAITSHKLSHPIPFHISDNQQNTTKSCACSSSCRASLGKTNQSKASCRRARKLHSKMRCQCWKHAPHDDTDDAPCPLPPLSSLVDGKLRQKLRRQHRRQMQIAAKL